MAAFRAPPAMPLPASPGFLRLRCGGCGRYRLVAFSCKRLGFCPSCGASRMAQTAARMVDHVNPNALAAVAREGDRFAATNSGHRMSLMGRQRPISVPSGPVNAGLAEYWRGSVEVECRPRAASYCAWSANFRACSSPLASTRSTPSGTAPRIVCAHACILTLAATSHLNECPACPRIARPNPSPPP